jgi:tetratricopeptide (TPR) repeat protein
MARAAVKAKQQARGKAAQQASKGRGRRKHAGGGNPNQQLFFERMRRHAKWAYVILAVLFAVTFAALGVGSGSNSGLDQIFSGLNIFGGSGGTSISKAQKEVQKDPKSAKAYRDLATAYEAKAETANAIAALISYTNLKKKDASAWSELGGLQLQEAQQFASAYQDASSAQAAAAPSQSFLPTGTLGTAIGTNKVEQAASQQASTGVDTLYQQTVSAYQSALSSYQTVAKLHPKDANAQFQIANVAEASGDYTTAVAALKKYLKLDPATTQRAQIEKLIKQLSPAPAKPAKKSSSSGT